MQIELISVTGPAPVPGKKYSIIELAYKKDGKVEGKKLLSFANPKVFSEIQRYKQGDLLEIDSIKNEKGYWQWTSVIRADKAEVAEVAVDRAPILQGNKPVSNYETKEERAVKQQLIIRQSSLANAIHFFEGKKVDEAAVFALADKFVDYVNNEPKEVNFAGDEHEVF